MNNKKQVQEWMKEWCNLIDKSNLPKEDYWIETIFGKFKNPDIVLHQNESINEINVTLKYDKQEGSGMNKEKYNQIIDEVYKNYRNAFVEGHVHEELDECLSLEELIEEIKTDSEFSEKWGLKIEERELSLEERVDMFLDVYNGDNVFFNDDEHRIDVCNDYEIPTKLITITYKNETIEIYE